MKTEIFRRLGHKYFLFGFFVSLFIGCSKDEEPVVLFRYASDSFEVNFQSEGTIPAPTINWPGTKGNFALKEAKEGLVIDPNTGAISVEKSLKIGAHEVVVYAINDKGTWITDFNLNYKIVETSLKGGQNNQPNSIFAIFIDRNLTLYEDGTLNIEIQNQEDSLGVGVWTLENETFKMHLCTYCADKDPQTIPNYDEHSYYEGTLKYDEDDGAYLQGQWYVIRFDPDSKTLRGDFVFSWDWN